MKIAQLYHAHDVLAGLNDKVFIKLDDTLDNNYCVVGGVAVIAHTSFSVRQVSPDIDLMLNSRGLQKAIAAYKTTPIRFGVTTTVDGLEIDLLLARSRLELAAIESATRIDLFGVSMRVIRAAYLIAIKFITGRDKDIQDLLLLYKWQPFEFKEARELIIHYKLNMLEDFDNEVELIKHWASIS